MYKAHKNKNIAKCVKIQRLFIITNTLCTILGANIWSTTVTAIEIAVIIVIFVIAPSISNILRDNTLTTCWF